MRILFVAMLASCHTVGWVNQLSDQGWDLHLFPVFDDVVHGGFRNVTVHDALGFRSPHADPSVRDADPLWPLSIGARSARRVAERLFPHWKERAWRLARVIDRLQPDLIHSMEMQHGAYLVYDARKQVQRRFPKWFVTIWGSDIYFYGRFPDHAVRIREVLTACDAFLSEGQRDVDLARQFGFIGEVFPPMPVTGGHDVDRLRALRTPGATSERRVIALKGYQHWAGRALVGVAALRLAADALQGYRIVIYAVQNSDVVLAARLLEADTGVPVEIIPWGVSQEELLRLHGRARISIGLSISDGISVSFLEALMMGSFPIQSNTSCANEWIVDGRSGLLTPPEDPVAIAAAIRRALGDDALVDRAAEENARTAEERLDPRKLRPQAQQIYRHLVRR